MVFIGDLFGIHSERQLVREIQVNGAYHWFLDLSLADQVINASMFSQHHRRRFLATDIEQQIFDAIVQQAIDHDFVGGTVLYADSTHLKASAKKHKFEPQIVTQAPVDYLHDLAQTVEEDRAAHGKPSLKAKASEEETHEIKSSTTDPEND